MSLKSDKLTKRIQGLQQFVADKIDQHETDQTVSETLTNLAVIQSSQKLTLQIISANLEAVIYLQTQLNKSSIITEKCEVKVASLPQKIEQPKPKKLPILKLEILDEKTGEIKSITYSLSDLENIKIGRDPSNHVLIPANHTLVSRLHGEIELISSADDSNLIQVQLKNTNSRYGIYFNQEKVESRILEEGDRIILGSPDLTSKSAAITLEYEVEEIVSKDNFDWELVNCDILCLIIDANDKLNAEELWLLEKTQQSSIHKRIVIAQFSENDELTKIDEKSLEIEKQIRCHLSITDVKLETLMLSDISNEVDLPKQAIKKLEKFIQSLERAIKMRPEDILSQRLNCLVEQQKQRVHCILEQKRDEINKQIQTIEVNLNRLNVTNFKDTLKKTLVEIREKQGRFFKFAKDDINSSKSKLLDPLNRSGLPAKFKEFLECLFPIIKFQEGSCIVQLHSTDQDLHQSAINLLQTELNFWALEEWEKVKTEYGNGGVGNLLQKSYSLLETFPSISDLKTLLQPIDSVKIPQESSNSICTPNLEKQDKQPNLGGYILHKVRQNMILTTMFLGIVIGGISGIFSPLLNQVPLFISLSEQVATIFPKGGSRNILGFLIIPALLPMTIRQYRKDKTNNSKKITQQLRDELSKHYEAFFKEHTDNITKALLLSLDELNYQFTKALEKLESEYINHLSLLEQQKQEYKTMISQQNQLLRAIDMQLNTLKKL